MDGAMFLRMFVIVVIVAASSTAATSDPQPVEAGQGVRPEYGWPRPIHWPWWPTPSSPPPPPPSPPTDPWWCNRTYGEESLSGADDVDCPPPSAPTTPTPPSCPRPCLCPRWPRPSSVVGTASATTTTDCLAPLAAVKSCGPFLTGADDRTPTLTSPCCTGLRTVLNSTSAAADPAAGGGDDDGLLLRCVCSLFLGDAHRLLPKPVDVERMLYLPVACSVALPPELFYVCYTGRTSAPVVSSFSELGH